MKTLGRLGAAFLLLAFGLPGAAYAQVAVTLGTTAVQIMPAGQSSALEICNQSATTTTTITICFADSAGDACTPAANTAGQYTIGGGSCHQWTRMLPPPQTAIYGIASAASTPVTIWRP
jgi:hypothetical protein